MVLIQPHLATTEDGSTAGLFLHCSAVPQDMLSVHTVV